MAIENKGKDVIEERSCVNILGMTNNTLDVKVTARRMRILKTSSVLMGNAEHWNKFHKLTTRSAKAAMHYDLKHRVNLAGFRPGDEFSIPLDMQVQLWKFKLTSLSGNGAWYVKCLTQGRFSSFAHDDTQCESFDIEAGLQIDTTRLRRLFLDSEYGQCRYDHSNDRMFGQELAKMAPNPEDPDASLIEKSRLPPSKGRHMVYTFPSLKRLRKAFAKHVKTPIKTVFPSCEPPPANKAQSWAEYRAKHVMPMHWRRFGAGVQLRGLIRGMRQLKELKDEANKPKPLQRSDMSAVMALYCNY